MEPEPVEPLHAAANRQPRTDLRADESAAGACGQPLDEPAIKECKRELEAVLAALGDA